MPRRPSAFRQSDVAKAIKAAVAAGLRVVGVKVSAEGNIEVVTGDGDKELSGGNKELSGGNEWDHV